MWLLLMFVTANPTIQTIEFTNKAQCENVAHILVQYQTENFKAICVKK